MARITVVINPSAQLVPISFSRSSPFAPDKNRMIAVLVKPKRSISKKFPAVIKINHSPKIFGTKVRASMIKLKERINAAPKLLASDRKLSLFKALEKFDFTFVDLVNSYFYLQPKR